MNKEMKPLWVLCVMTSESGKPKTDEVVLPIGATADQGSCGSCQFFDRYGEMDYYQAIGYCKIRMPPYKQRLMLKPYTESDSDWGPNRVKDTDGCDLHRHSGKTYIVARRVEPMKA
jgi:hypothetical protein